MTGTQAEPARDLFAFSWGRDEKGCELIEAAPPGAPPASRLLLSPEFAAPVIRRAGGPLANYLPESEYPEGKNWINRPLHRHFATCGTGADGALTSEDALRFVKAWGFLTVPAGAPEESISAIVGVHRALWTLLHFEETNRDIVRNAGRVRGGLRRRLDKKGRLIGRLAEFFNAYTVPVKMKIAVDASDPRKPELHVGPTTLAAWMILQYARELTGNVRYTACANEACGELMKIESEGDLRTLRGKFCGDACKQADYRRRKRHGKGKRHAKR